MLRKRVEVLFDEQEYKRLEQIARAKKQSVGSLVREAVEKYVVRPSVEERRKAFEDLLSIDGGPVGSPEEIKKIITNSELVAMLKSLDYPEDAERIRKLERDLNRLIRDIEAR